MSKVVNQLESVVTHILWDDEDPARTAKYVCGLDVLPEGHRHWYPYERMADHATCRGCNPNPRHLGTPISKLSGRPGHEGFAEFSRIARSWGYD